MLQDALKDNLKNFSTISSLTIKANKTTVANKNIKGRKKIRRDEKNQFSIFLKAEGNMSEEKVFFYYYFVR